MRTFFAGEEEGLGVCAEDHKSCQPSRGEVVEVGGLGSEVDGVGYGVEECDGWTPDAGFGDVGFCRSDRAHFAEMFMFFQYLYTGIEEIE